MDLTIGRTLGSRELASSKVKSFITRSNSRSHILLVLDERGHLKELGIEPANGVSTGSGSDRVPIQATLEFARTITRSLSLPVLTSSRYLTAAEVRSASPLGM